MTLPLALDFHTFTSPYAIALINQELKDDPWGGYCNARGKPIENDEEMMLIHYETEKIAYKKYYKKL